MRIEMFLEPPDWKETRGRGDAGTRGRGDAGTRGRGDAGTRGRGRSEGRRGGKGCRCRWWP
ncbi:MAG: hypothetical protein F6K41_04025 [Symploca sp. SIO3E6]|nr:hypothetical protein [Caldora sp. SIO3E6]